MANELDEKTGTVNVSGRDIGVIDKQLPVTVGVGSKIFEAILWCLGIFPGLIFLFKKIGARTYLSQMQQKIQQAASTVDNLLEQRVVILQNAAGIVEKAVNLDKNTFGDIARARAGIAPAADGSHDAARNETQGIADNVMRKIQVQMEAYPELRAHESLASAMQQNSTLQKEITAGRERYNDVVSTWNTAIYEWPTKKIVAAKAGYTTRVPFSASAEIKERARAKFF